MSSTFAFFLGLASPSPPAGARFFFALPVPLPFEGGGVASTSRVCNQHYSMMPFTHKLLMNFHQLVVVDALPGPEETCKAVCQLQLPTKTTYTQQCLRHFFPSSPRDSCSLTISSIRAPMPATHSLSALILSSRLRLSVPDLSFFCNGSGLRGLETYEMLLGGSQLLLENVLIH